MLLLVLDVLPVGDGAGSDDVVDDDFLSDVAPGGFEAATFLGVEPPLRD